MHRLFLHRLSLLAVCMSLSTIVGCPELSTIVGTFEECVDEPVARAALVTGQAGAGKSRMAAEFLLAA